MRLRVQDEHGRPATAAFLIRDALDRIYPNISKRLAPDFFFQPQVYRADGETIDLPAGQFTVTVTRGPEYLSADAAFAGRRAAASCSSGWCAGSIPSQYGWYSGDHHIHSAGCSHYENPTEGVGPEDMWPQIDGEALNVASVLTWGPSYYYQKQFFSGADHPLSTPTRLMHYDLEISGFPSSHAGHLVLLGLKDQDYPGTKRLEDWPTWTLPILKWAKAQGAVVGFAHSGWGLEVKQQRAAQLRDARLRRHRRQRVHRRRHASGHRRLHLGRRHAVRLGAEHLVPHAERRVPHAHQRRDRLSLHLPTTGSAWRARTRRWTGR